jgi:hypothetical protein
MKSKSIEFQYTEEIEGKSVTIHKIKPKAKKGISYGRPNYNICPYCNSKLDIDSAGLQKCSGDKLEFWQKEFIKFSKLGDNAKVKYITTISEESQFFELYDRWTFAQIPENEEQFNCGYTNKIFFPMPSGNVTIPDPVRVAYVEKRVGRPLTEEELYGESELWQFGRQILKEYKKGARKLKIALIRFPGDC